ncbi:hypothetical protein [Frigoribacterium faeni]|uniref:Uncharacterized protein n=1 Tax=Frigoribacterium faeni TaxID=145483 RepID=A0A7W3PHM2_9MICO|nr:hypothetical protein [Frigoribacterium faeni]MBA8812475.1 hypothetical protein [Frigoribacterium faeni]BFF13560.1 hypothetical protein GCM10025699_48630 [Microbacterium flavescens]GEK81808.1 hypothetical protein FFA01_01170 [Frigoribacterium faeni]
MIVTPATVVETSSASWASIDPAAVSLPATRQVDLTSYVVAAQSVV